MSDLGLRRSLLLWLLSGGAAVAQPAPTKPPGGLDGGTMIGTTPLSTVVTQAAAAIPHSMIGAASGIAPLNAGGLVPRVNLPVNSLNLATMGAALDGSSADQTTIQGIYAGLPNGAVVSVPQSSHWAGGITAPTPDKVETWIFDGAQGGIYPPPPGDGDLEHDLTDPTRKFFPDAARV